MKRLVPHVLLVLAIICRLCTTPHAIAKFASESLLPKERIEVFETIWKTINDDYYDPAFNGVDWDSVRERYRPRVEVAKSDDEFDSLIKLMLLELQDLHTAFVSHSEQSLIM